MLVVFAIAINTTVLKKQTTDMIVSDNPGRDQLTGINPNIRTLTAPWMKKLIIESLNFFHILKYSMQLSGRDNV